MYYSVRLSDELDLDQNVLDALGPEAFRAAIIENLADKFKGMSLRATFEHLYDEANREPCESCEVELEASYPGILYRAEPPWGHVNTAQRCDTCERYDSDLLAQQALHRLLMDATGEVFFCWRCDEQHHWTERMAAIREPDDEDEHCVHARCVLPSDLVLEFIDPAPEVT